MLTLAQSIEQADLTALKEWIDDGVNLNQPCKDEKFPLRIAIDQLFIADPEKIIPIIDCLLAAGADPRKIVFEHEASLLHFFARQGDTRAKIQGLIRSPRVSDQTNGQLKELSLRMIKKFLPFMRDQLNQPDQDGITPLYLAEMSENVDLVTFFLEQKADVNLAPPSGTTFFHLAVCSKRNESQLKELLEAKVDMNAKNKHGYTPLDYASDLSIILFLLKQGALFNERDLLWAFKEAQQKNHTELLDYLFSKGIASYRNSKGEFALCYAHSYAVLEKLLKENALSNLSPKEQNRVIRNQTLWVHYDTNSEKDEQEKLRRLQLLHEHKADLHVKDAAGNGLLYYTAAESFQLTQFLLKAGLSINTINQKGETALHHAAEYFDSSIVKLLLDNKADPLISDEKKLVPLEKLQYKVIHDRGFVPDSAIPIIEELLKLYPTDQLPRNASALGLIAAHFNQLNLIKALYARGLSLLQKDENNFNLNVYELAVQKGHMDLVEWLLTTPDIHSDFVSKTTKKPTKTSTHQESKNVPTSKKTMADEMLHIAVRYLRDDIVLLLLKAGVALDQFPLTGISLWSVFIEAISHNHSDASPEEFRIAAKKIFSLLLEQKININQKNQHGQTPLQEMLHSYYPIYKYPFIRALINNGATLPEDINEMVGLVRLAIRAKDKKLLPYIFKNCSQEKKSVYIEKLALLAVQESQLELLDELLSQGLKLDAQLSLGNQYSSHYLLNTALTSYFGNEPEKSIKQQQVVSYLIQHGAPLHYPVLRFGCATEENLSLLHLAANRGWLKIVELLLEPHYGFTVDQLATTREQETPLQLAVEQRHLPVVRFLVEQHANVRIRGKEGKTLLHIACQQGDIEMARYLLNLKIIDINAQCERRITAIKYALLSSDKGIAEKLIRLFLDNDASVDPVLVRMMLQKNLPYDLIQRTADKLSTHELQAACILHTAVENGSLALCQYLLKRDRGLLTTRDGQGRTPLHIATPAHRKNIYDFLIESGSSLDERDYEGYDVYAYAFCHNNIFMQHLNLIIEETTEIKAQNLLTLIQEYLSDKLTLNLVEFKKLRNTLIVQKEFSSGGEQSLFALSRYCYNLIHLFDSATDAISYIEKHKNPHSRQPIHDLCLFQLPSQTAWQREKWANLLLVHGPALMPFLHLAPQIEKALKRAPTTLEEIKEIAPTLRYAREAEQPKLAELFLQHQVPEAAFNYTLQWYQKKTRDHLPDIQVAGTELKHSEYRKYYLKKLAPDDARGFILGALTRCCQSIGSAGAGCAMHGMTSPYGGFYAVFKQPLEEIKKSQIIFDKAMLADNIETFLQQISEKGQRQSFQKKYSEIKQTLEKEHKAHHSFTLFRQQLKQKLELLEEGELIAQCWGWINEKNDALVLDSWEQKRDNYSELCRPFLENLGQQAVKNYGFKRVLLGTGGQTPTKLELKKVMTAESPQDYAGYRDSQEQYLLSAAEPVTTQITETIASLNEGYSAHEINESLKAIFSSQTNIKLMPAIELASTEEKNVLELLSAAFSSFEATEEKSDSEKNRFIIPILAKSNFWNAYIIEKDRFIYLDFAARSLPLELWPLLSNYHYSNKVYVLPASYNQEPAESALWLIDTLQHLATTDSLLIPAQQIREKRAKKITDTLETFYLKTTVLETVLSYCDLRSLTKMTPLGRPSFTLFSGATTTNRETNLVAEHKAGIVEGQRH